MCDLPKVNELRRQKCVTFLLLSLGFVRMFHVLRDLRAANIVLGLPWLDDKQATREFGADRLFTLRDGTIIENQVIERPPQCLLMSSTKAQKMMRKSARAKGRTAEFFMVHLAAAKQYSPSEFHLGNELSDRQHREDLRTI
jgi:hypothetical protein